MFLGKNLLIIVLLTIVINKMKTKHLFYTVALASAFAACTNEEIINEAPQLSVEATRPIVSNVALDLGTAESRMSYNDGKFEWVNGDKIAVMLMDQNNTGVRYGSSTLTDEWEALSWLERYHLVDYVHTNYPFTLDNGVWKTDANMLEGNYFLVYPAAEFDGKRQAYFDISEQKQIGNTAQSRKDAYAQNQRFVGYARLDAAAGASTLKARMSEVLAPVRVNIQSNCTQVAGEPLEIRKIVLTHPTFHSQFSIDPTTADYRDWNLTSYGTQATLPGDNNDAVNNWSYEQFFNYANYLTATGIRNSEKELYMHEFEGSVDAEDYVWNAYKMGDIADKWSEKPEENKRKADTYYYDEAIRAIVKPLWKENWSENVTKFIEVYTYAADGKKPYTLASGANATLGVVAMVPAFNDWNSHNDNEGGLELYIYTNKGLVGPVDLSVKHTGNTGSNVQTTDAILAADPRIDMNTVTVIIDDDDIVATPDQKLINNEDDLANYVDYYTKNATNSRVDVMITNDIKINDELAAKIIAMKEDAGVDIVSLYISSAEGVSKNANITLETKVNSNILNWLDIDDDVLVEVAKGAVVDLSPSARNYVSADNDLNILVDNGGTLNFVNDMTSVGGWSNVTDYAANALNTIVENNGTVNIKSSVANHAGLQIENNNVMNVEAGAYISLANESVNTLNGVINVEGTARLGATTNENIVNRGTIENRGEIYSVENALAESHTDKILPGRIVIDAAGALTTLTENKGQVIYNVLPTVPVIVADGDYNTGMFIFETNANVTTEALTTHHVTDATINGAVLSTNTINTTLRRLTLNDGSSLVSSIVPEAPAHMCFNASLSANNAVWDNNKVAEHTFTTNGNVKFENVNVCFLENDYIVTLNNGKITSLKEVGFWYLLGSKTAAWVDLNAVEMTVGDGTTASFTALELTADNDVTSTIWVRPNATLNANNNDPEYILINK